MQATQAPPLKFFRRLTIQSEPYASLQFRWMGERDLAKLAQNADREGVWWYHQKMRVWAFLNQTTEKIDSESYAGMSVKQEVRPTGADWENYHIHPASSQDTTQHPEDANISEASKQALLTSPSVGDLLTYRTFESNRSHIISPYGKTTIILNDKTFGKQLRTYNLTLQRLAAIGTPIVETHRTLEQTLEGKVQITYTPR